MGQRDQQRDFHTQNLLATGRAPSPPAANGLPARRSCPGAPLAPPSAARPRSAPARLHLASAPHTPRVRIGLRLRRRQRLAIHLPFGVSGSASSRTYAAGTMYSGSAADRCAAQASALPNLLTAVVRHQSLLAAHCPRAPAPPLHAPPGCSRSRASISPSSIRKPRIFT